MQRRLKVFGAFPGIVHDAFVHLTITLVYWKRLAWRTLIPEDAQVADRFPVPSSVCLRLVRRGNLPLMSTLQIPLTAVSNEKMFLEIELLACVAVVVYPRP